VYWLKVYEIPEAAAATRGKAISQPGEISGGRAPDRVIERRNLEEEGTFLFFANAQRHGKETALNEFSNPAQRPALFASTHG